MRVRAITIGQNVPLLDDNEIMFSDLEEKLVRFCNFYEDLIADFETKLDLDVESRRMCTQPIFNTDVKLMYERDHEEAASLIQEQLRQVSTLIKGYKIDYLAACMMLADNLKDFGIVEELLLSKVPKIIEKNDTFFTSVQAATSKNEINFSALKACAKIIKKNSLINSFNNLNFCVSSNVQPNTPFFPAAYHLSDNPSFSIAFEMADDVAKIFGDASNLTEAKIKLKRHFLGIYDSISEISEKIGNNHGIAFEGMDFSPAPYPKTTRSIGHALENLGFEYYGAHGTLIAAALIKKCIPAKEKVIGFSGFMQPVLEDNVISKRLMENCFSLDTLLLYSTMCGTGLDCVPLPGDITERELFYILLDICTISVILNKPLTARLMPIPGKKAGDGVKFDFEYFAPSAVMKIRRLSESTSDLFSRIENDFDFY